MKQLRPTSAQAENTINCTCGRPIGIVPEPLSYNRPGARVWKITRHMRPDRTPCPDSLTEAPPPR